GRSIRPPVRSVLQPAPVWVTAPDGARLHVVDQGKGDPVLWLQGLNAPAAAWAVQLAHFSQTHRGIAPDARGVGQSDAPPGPYTVKQMAQDAIAVLDALEVDRAHLVGLSLGGAVAQGLAIPPPGRVRSPGLVATVGAQAARGRALLQAWRALYPAGIGGARLPKAWELPAYCWLFPERFWRSEANVRAALRFASS